jgi:hypothetical protein
LAVALGSALTTLDFGWELGGDVHSPTSRWRQSSERETEDALRPLERDGWRTIHDIDCGRPCSRLR